MNGRTFRAAAKRSPLVAQIDIGRARASSGGIPDKPTWVLNQGAWSSLVIVALVDPDGMSRFDSEIVATIEENQSTDDLVYDVMTADYDWAGVAPVPEQLNNVADVIAYVTAMQRMTQ